MLIKVKSLEATTLDFQGTAWPKKEEK